MSCEGVLAVGKGHSIGHHGEILQGVFRGANGCIVPGLMTLPCSSFKVQARFAAKATTVVEIQAEGGSALSKSRRAAALAIEALGVADGRVGGALHLTSNIPLGRGLGSSTADVVATLRAVADAHERAFSETELARLAVAAEGAADPVMFSRPGCLLFAQRRGDILQEFSGVLPAMTLLSIDTDPLGAGMDTLSRDVPHYSGREIRQFERLRIELQRGIQQQDLSSIATVATASAHLNEKYLRKPGLLDLATVGFRMGALGLQVAHSGSVVGLIFDPRDPKLEDHLRECDQVCSRLGFGRSARLEVGGLLSRQQVAVTNPS